jgi:hypothetical protein
LAEGDFITATLVWDRIVDETNGIGGTAGDVDENDTYAFSALADLELNFYYKDGDTDVLFAESVASDDNVEHLHVPVPRAGTPLDYFIEVELAGGGTTDYGLAWWTTPEPTTLALMVFGLALAKLRRRRAA